MIPPVANNFVAGEDAESALSYVSDVNERGIRGIVNLLGEHYDSRADADADAREYLELVERIGDSDLDCTVSVKPSQIGLGAGETAFEENLERIVERATERDVFVWVDMEDHETTDATLDAFEANARASDGNVGVCVQANLKRTGEDLARLADVPGKVRLVKGAYDEPKSLAYKDKSVVDEKYREYLEFMFREFDDGVAVGSHDLSMVNFAADLYREHRTPFEVQMLMGVREDVQEQLVGRMPVYQYIPYGDKWMSYFYRRVRERKENALFALRAVLS
ncbi:proline dehydrogenase family protein [Halopelagius longus]|uniref:proline dehydrogenase n=1 Tax=Halopelagius longus TaxID=1236180 RepID=A0A1H1BH64_9EURY|nr:proline dehydrogenase family protein [Halopelagius longus]RDI70785.1 proline dehydrogenase [Halopelagius longus]SDQ51213.1 L-proline dehydrogenase [Halopelagius longus]